MGEDVNKSENCFGHWLAGLKKNPKSIFAHMTVKMMFNSSHIVFLEHQRLHQLPNKDKIDK